MVGPMQQLNGDARQYIEALVATLKHEGALSQPQVEAAFLRVPRHAFLDRFFRREVRAREAHMQEFCPASFAHFDDWLRAIYVDEPLITAYDDAYTATSSSSSPGAMAVMLEAAEIRRRMRVLEIGSGTGYNAALLAVIVGSPQRVVTVEIDADIAAQARLRLNHVVGLGVTVHTGNGFDGYAKGAPYDRIIATGSTRSVPLSWLEQIRPGGIILMNLIGEMGVSAFLKVVKKEARFAAHGRFLAGSTFLELREAGDLPHPCTARVDRFLSRPITAQMESSRVVFDLALLWDRRLKFVLQLAFPHMFIASVSADSTCFCFVDQASETSLVFRPSDGEFFRVEVRGDASVWDRIQAVYQQWMGLGRPDVTAYYLHIDSSGNQVVTLAPSPERRGIPAWVLHEES